MSGRDYGDRKSDQQEKGRSDSEVPMAVSEEDVKLAQIVVQTKPGETPQSANQSSWMARLCSCFPPANRRTRAGHKDKGVLLPPQLPCHFGKPTLVLDLDETLVHASFIPGTTGDFVFDLDLEGHLYTVSVLFRPEVHFFLSSVAQFYEVVVFTASMSIYADRVIDVLDTTRAVTTRLFRESCTYIDGTYVKNLDLLGRDLHRVVILDVRDT